MPFQLKRQSAKVAHLNVREEKHGEESVVAVDVKVQADVGNELLDSLSPGLREAFYAKEEGGLGGVDPAFSVLRFPQLAPLHWEETIAACEFTVHGAKRADDLAFTGEVAKPLVLSVKEGGTVSLTLQVQIRPDATELGALSSFLGRSTKVTLRPAEQPPAPPAE